jgi:UDP-glucuronate decarboxylase
MSMSSVKLNSIIEEIRSIVPNAFEGKKVAITGGAGFIGSWLCDVLVSYGSHVVCIDNLVSGRRENIAHLIGDTNFGFVMESIERWEAEEKYDIIIHAASIPNPDHYAMKPVETALSNSIATHKLLEIARKQDSLFLYMSSSEVYGDAEVVPTPEWYAGKLDPVGPRSCYYESKRFGETLCMAYHQQYGVDVRICRLFNCYGPRLDTGSSYSRVIPRFLEQARKGEPITVHGDGKQTRSFCYITDAVSGILLMLVNKNCMARPLNIGNPEEVTILGLAEKIKKLTGSNSVITFEPPRPNDPRRRCPDISLARELLRWEPKVALDEGLMRYMSGDDHPAKGRLAQGRS